VECVINDGGGMSEFADSSRLCSYQHNITNNERKLYESIQSTNAF